MNIIWQRPVKCPDCKQECYSFREFQEHERKHDNDRRKNNLERLRDEPAAPLDNLEARVRREQRQRWQA